MEFILETHSDMRFKITKNGTSENVSLVGNACPRNWSLKKVKRNYAEKFRFFNKILLQYAKSRRHIKIVWILRFYYIFVLTTGLYKIYTIRKIQAFITLHYLVNCVIWNIYLRPGRNPTEIRCPLPPRYHEMGETHIFALFTPVPMRSRYFSCIFNDFIWHRLYRIVYTV